MAIFEQKAYGKVILDDTEELKVVFENAQNVQGHTEYVIRVQRGPRPERSWHICKRYNDFIALHNTVVQQSGLPLVLPPKKLLGNMDRNFIAERQQALQTYTNQILMNPILASSLGVRKFLDPENYTVSLQEQASQQVSMALRGELNYELVKGIPDMGWRLRKHYFSVRARLNPRADMVLQWVEYGPDKYIEEREIFSILKSFSQIVHPHIHPLEFVHCSESGCFVIRHFNAEGTLRDLLCGSKPKTPFLKKYANPKQSYELPVTDIADYGRQILDTLAFLREKDIPFGHLHAGNVILACGQARLLDVENGLLGLPSYYRPFFVQHRKINTLEAVDVYCFGHLLYEMTFGHHLHESVCDTFPASCPPSIRAVLELILSSESCRSGMPSISQLQHHPFFNSGRENDPLRINLRLPSSLRDALKTAGASTEKRLHNEQKLVRSQKKIAKVQEFLSSEEEIKKRKQRLKEERKANHANSKRGPESPTGKHPPNSHKCKSPPRSESPTSTSTATSAGTVTPPPSGAKPVAIASTTVTTVDETGGRRSALLDSICSFDKGSLRPRNNNGTVRN